jgi:predicted nucleic acid-binding protein
MNGFLIDTNVLSEVLRPSPDPNVLAWSIQAPQEKLFLSVVSLGELSKGLAMMPSGQKKARLEESVSNLIEKWFAGRILPVSEGIARRWGVLESERLSLGRPIHVPDAQIAATALEHQLTLVTRNLKDFEHLGIGLLNPWRNDASLPV